MPLALRARHMLVAAYAWQSAERSGNEGDTFAWKVWAAKAGHDPDEARGALQDLIALGLVRLKDFEELTLETAGVELVERDALADEDLLARQFDLRQAILKVLDQDRVAHPGHGSVKLQMIVNLVGELGGMVRFGLRVMKGAGLIEEGAEGVSTSAYRISVLGRDALARRPLAWPLSAHREESQGSAGARPG
jgi:hypothetical protein